MKEISIYDTELIGEIIKGDTVYQMFVGITLEQTEQLKALSLDESDVALNVTSDRVRFGEKSFTDWFNKGRVPYTLIERDSDKLAALVWFGPKALGEKSMKFQAAGQENIAAAPDEVWHTLAYRSYPPFRGGGFMKEFFARAMEHYRSWFPDAKLWAIIDIENPASTRLAESSGFVIDKEHSDNQHAVMIHQNDL